VCNKQQGFVLKLFHEKAFSWFAKDIAGASGPDTRTVQSVKVLFITGFKRFDLVWFYTVWFGLVWL
jgi:hypothetical protein